MPREQTTRVFFPSLRRPDLGSGKSHSGVAYVRREDVAELRAPQESERCKTVCRRVGARPEACYEEDEVVMPDALWVLAHLETMKAFQFYFHLQYPVIGLCPKTGRKFKFEITVLDSLADMRG